MSTYSSPLGDALKAIYPYASRYISITYMDDLSQLLDDAAIDLHGRAGTWREALTRAGELLEQAGAASADYTAEMIASVEQHGPYIVIAPGFAFAHARPSPAVNRRALSWLRLEEPVVFGHPDNDPVDLVVGLCATDDKAHTRALAQLSKLLASRRSLLDAAATPAQLRAALEPKAARTAAGAGKGAKQGASTSGGEDHRLILTVCGNGLGTSLFLKNTLESVLDEWGWAPFISVEATDTISAKGRASQADCILTSGEIARTLGEVGVPVAVIANFTSRAEIDSALRGLYDLDALNPNDQQEHA